MLKFEYDEAADVITIEGIRYNGEMFRQLGGVLPLNQPFMVVERNTALTVMRAGDMSPIAWPMRRVQITFTHETLGDNRFGHLIDAAFAEHRAKLAAQPHALSHEWHVADQTGTLMGDLDDYRASNGVLVHTQVPPFDEANEPPDYMAQITYQYECGYAAGIKKALDNPEAFANLSPEERAAVTAVPPYQGQKNG